MPKKHTTKLSFKKGFATGILFVLIVAFGGYVVYTGKFFGNDNQEEESQQTSDEESSAEQVLNNDSQKEDQDKVEVENKEENKDEEAVGGSGDEKTDEEIAAEAKKAAGESATSSKTYQNETYAYSVKYPSDWQKDEAAGQIGFLPPDKKSTEHFDGDIIINHKENPDDLSIKEHYNGTDDVNLFQDAIGGYEEIKSGYLEAYKFIDVQGYVPSNVVVIKTTNGFVEITDVGAQHDEDGVFDEVVASFNVK